MECRTPLVEYVKTGDGAGAAGNVHNLGPSAAAAARVARNARPGRSGGRNPPTPAIKRRLPLPKNVVLMSLIEATELAAENVQGQTHEPSLNESPMVTPSVLDFDDNEAEKIKTGTSLAISDCGTYAVAAKDGLEIFPSRPEALPFSGIDHSEDDVDTLVRFFHMDHNLDLGADGVPDDKKMEEDSRKNATPGRLSWGDRVQIVSTQNGWAKLARGYGFVRAGAQQLVKGTNLCVLKGIIPSNSESQFRTLSCCAFLSFGVLPLLTRRPRTSCHKFAMLVTVGGSVDRSCKLEAMLRMLSCRRMELREEQKRIDNNFIALMNELQMSLMADEDLTVIAADTFHKDLENDPSTASMVRARELGASLEMQPPEIQANDSFIDHTPLKPRFMERPMTPPGNTGLFFCSGSDVLNAVLPSSSGRTQPSALPSVTRSPAIAQEFSNSQHGVNQHRQHSPRQLHHEQDHYSHPENTPTRILTSASHPSPGALRAGARAWREMHGRPPSDGIDFRTGMSGHSALLSSSAHAHDYLGQSHRFFAAMSNHTGLTMWKSAGKSSELRPPVFPTSGSTESNSED